MSSNNINWFGVAVAAAVTSLGIYAIVRSFADDEIEVKPTASETKTDSVKSEVYAKRAVNDLYRDLLDSAKAMYGDLQSDTTLTKESKKEKFEALMVSLVEAHLNINDCKLDENRTYVKWLRDMRIENPEFWERVIRKSADTGAEGAKSIYAIVVAINFSNMNAPVEAVALTVADLNTCLTVEDAKAVGLELPEGEYTVTVESIVDIPAKVVFLSKTHRVVVTETV
ncbi:hypothetical protein pEaSNUABM54_00124 [Erwinia phage pEa_SNUABM_54]|nr:hypothetical protein pEaSNUABM54_00124 [Erwinia phage pEa_SNUABM_54]